MTNPIRFRTRHGQDTKYHSTTVITEDGKFRSRKEFARWMDLKLLQKSGEISGLERQVKYELAPTVTLYGRKRPPLRYFCDFRYKRDGRMIVEDAKGFRDGKYKIKRHLMATVHGIEILET